MTHSPVLYREIHCGILLGEYYLSTKCVRILHCLYYQLKNIPAESEYSATCLLQPAVMNSCKHFWETPTYACYKKLTPHCCIKLPWLRIYEGIIDSLEQAQSQYLVTVYWSCGDHYSVELVDTVNTMFPLLNTYRCLSYVKTPVRNMCIYQWAIYLKRLLIKLENTGELMHSVTYIVMQWTARFL